MSALRIAALRLLSPDPELTSAFYEAAFGATSGADGHLKLGRQTIELVKTSAKLGPGAPSNSTGFQHFAIVVSNMDAAFAHLQTIPGWKAISRAGPEQLPASSGGAKAFKFRDPDGHPLELLQFAPASAPLAWQDQTGLCLGIDHTAITVADTRTSIAFYRDFGFTISGQGINQGPEQARMDDVLDPLVEVTGLTPPGGTPPHLELLCYRQPDVRRDPCRPDDVLATRMIFTDTRQVAGEGADPDGHRFVLL